MSKRRRKKVAIAVKALTHADDCAPDWTKKCETCGATPVLPVTGMCGPCTLGEAATAGGCW
jgi:hypothetical protein